MFGEHQHGLRIDGLTLPERLHELVEITQGGVGDMIVDVETDCCNVGVDVARVRRIFLDAQHDVGCVRLGLEVDFCPKAFPADLFVADFLAEIHQQMVVGIVALGA